VHACASYPGERAERFDREGFLRQVATHLRVRPLQAEAITRAVFGVLRQLLPVKERHDVASQLPRDLQEL
jgi:uncharacterized protein (DUF2267 family)